MDRRAVAAAEPREPGRLDRAQRERVIGEQQLDREVEHDLVVGDLDEMEQRRR